MSAYRIGIIGGGAAGIAAAHVLSRAHEVTLFEREASLGGHVVTLPVDEDGRAISLDAGFMVMNDRNYPAVHRLLAQLGVDGIEPSEMSFGYRSPSDGIGYAINSGAPVVARDAEPALGTLLMQALRFCRTASRDLAEGSLVGKTLAQYARSRGFNQAVIDHYLVPLGALTWLTPAEAMLEFPADAFVGFFDRHGLLALTDVPRWEHIRGGAARWVRAFEASFGGHIERGARDLRVRRDESGVTVYAPSRDARRFDYVVVATHADEALRLLDDPSPEEQSLLGAWRYRPTRALLHTDASVMPDDPDRWASWNATREKGAIATTYHLNRLQGHASAGRQYFLTFDDLVQVAEDSVLAEVQFTHPVLTVPARATQARIRAGNGTRRTYYCGSYLGFALHEDAVSSGFAVAEAFGSAP